MSPDEARRVLGLDPDLPVDAASARRAYLRRLPDHRPDRDPVGFGRLREALRTLERADPGVSTATAPAPATVSARLAEALLYAGAPEQDPAGDVALRNLAEALADDAAGRGPELPIAVLIEVVLGLHMRADPEPGRQAWAAVASWLEQTGRGTDAVRFGTLPLATARELAAVPPGLDPGLRVALARSARAWGEEDCGAAVAACRRRGAMYARAQAALLAEHAPNLHAWVGDRLDPHRHRRAAAREALFWLAVACAAFVVAGWIMSRPKTGVPVQEALRLLPRAELPAARRGGPDVARPDTAPSESAGGEDGG